MSDRANETAPAFADPTAGVVTGTPADALAPAAPSPRLRLPPLRFESAIPSPNFFEAIAWTLLAGGLAFAIGVFMLIPEQVARYAGPIACVVIAALAIGLLRRGKTDAAIAVLAIGSWCAITGIALFAGGARSTVMIAYPVIVVGAGWLAGLRMAYLLGGLTIVAVIAFVVGDAIGLLPSPPPTPVFLYGVVELMSVFVAMLSITNLVRTYGKRMAELHDANRQIVHHAARLEATRRELSRAQEVANTGSWVYRADRDSIRLSAEACRILDLPRAARLSLADFLLRIDADERPAVERAWNEAAQGGVLDCECRLRRVGGTRWIHLSAEVEFGPDLKLARVLGVIQDVTERKEAALKLEMAANVFASAREGIMITRTDGTIIDVNAAFTRITGYGRDEAIGANPRILKSGRHEREHYERMWKDLVEKGHWYGEIWNRRKNGEVFAEMQAISTVRDARGVAQQYVSLFSDITSQKEHEKQLERIAHYDPLTSLPNRVLLSDRMHQAMAQAERRGERLAVVYLDLDGFKAINDEHGHEVGDQLLMILASRMKIALREGDTLARLGGDEFVGLVLDLVDVNDCTPTLMRLLGATAHPVTVDGRTLRVSASLGVTFFPQADPVDADQLLRQADQAMYQAKLAGKNRFHIFDTDRDRDVRGQHESLERIRRALVEGEFVLHYQPKVNMRTGAVVGAEALIRWQHPERGLLAPGAFLPVTEEHVLAVDIGAWVIESALAQAEAWRHDGINLPVSINVSARHLQQADFAERLLAALRAHPEVPPGGLELEVLETSALEDLDRVARLIERCREFGVRFSLDDFGTGYSSLTYLKHLHVAQLKIDRSFVRDMLDDPEDLAILEGILGLATAFRREAIAEGVESDAHGSLLLELGCELAQGFGIARPMPAGEVAGWIESWRPPADWAQRQPVRREDLPVLFAVVEHRAWIVALERHLSGQAAMPPPTDPGQCHFGTWFGGEGHTRYGSHPGYPQIDALHRRIHALGEEACGLKKSGRTAEANQCIDMVKTLRDELVVLLRRLTVSESVS